VGAQDGRVAILRGIQGSLVGIPLQEPYLLGCISDQGQLSQITYNDSESSLSQGESSLDCQIMQLDDLKPSERPQVTAGLPAGSLDDAIGQLRELAHSSLLPLCAAAQMPGTDCRGPAAQLTPAAQAGPVPPIKLTGQVTDLSSAVDAAAVQEVRSAVDDLRLRHNIRLWVVYVDAFAGGPAGETIPAVDWARQTTNLSEMSDRAAILAVATESRSYAVLVSPGAAGRGGQAEIESFRANSIEPALRDKQWAAAGLAAAKGLADLAS
jgi:hypothetical protein